MLSIDWSSDVFSSDLRDTVVRFLADQVEPHYEKWEKAGIFPKELYLQMGEAGLLCVDQPEEYGGIGAPFAFSCVVVEEVARMGFLALASNLTRSEEHTSELQSLMRISYAVFCLKQKNKTIHS